jgi:hypothetical protein
MEFQLHVKLSYGEVEDYTVNIVAGAADTTAPAAPSSLAASGTTTQLQIYHGAHLQIT